MSILSVRFQSVTAHFLHKNNANKRAARITFLLFENAIYVLYDLGYLIKQEFNIVSFEKRSEIEKTISNKNTLRRVYYTRLIFRLIINGFNQFDFSIYHANSLTCLVFLDGIIVTRALTLMKIFI